MTVTAPAAPRSSAPGAEAQPVTLRRVIRSEWIKFWTLRSTWAVLGAAVVGMLVLALVVATTPGISPAISRQRHRAVVTLQGYYLAQLLIGAWVCCSSRVNMAPDDQIDAGRGAEAAAGAVGKLVVFVTVTVVSMIAVSSWLSCARRLAVALRTGFSLVILASCGSYRNGDLPDAGRHDRRRSGLDRAQHAGRLVAYFAVVLVLPVLFGDALGNWGKEVAQFLPAGRGQFLHQHPGVAALQPVAVGWPAGAGGLGRRSAGYRGRGARRRDA